MQNLHLIISLIILPLFQVNAAVVVNCVTRTNRNYVFDQQFGFRIDFNWFFDGYTKTDRIAESMLKLQRDNTFELVTHINGNNEFPIFYEGHQFLIPAYLLSPGYYVLKLDAVNQQCTFIVLPARSVPCISNGTVWVAPENQTVLVIGNQSVSDQSITIDEPEFFLTYNWSLKCTIQQKACAMLQSNDSVFTIPAQIMIQNERIQITLKLNTFFGAQNTTQDINVVKNISLAMNCGKNCAPHSKYSSTAAQTILYVQFEEIDEMSSYSWSIFENESRLPQNTLQIFESNHSALIEKNKLKPGMYSILFEKRGNDPNKNCQIELIFESPPIVSSCAIIPSEGVSYTTWFNLECNGNFKIWNDTSIYFMLCIDDIMETVLVSGFVNEMPTLQFQLPNLKNVQLKVKIADSKSNTISVSIKNFVLTTFDFQSKFNKQLSILQTNNFTIGFKQWLLDTKPSKDEPDLDMRYCLYVVKEVYKAKVIDKFSKTFATTAKLFNFLDNCIVSIQTKLNLRKSAKISVNDSNILEDSVEFAKRHNSSDFTQMVIYCLKIKLLTLSYSEKFITNTNTYFVQLAKTHYKHSVWNTTTQFKDVQVVFNKTVKQNLDYMLFVLKAKNWMFGKNKLLYGAVILHLIHSKSPNHFNINNIFNETIYTFKQPACIYFAIKKFKSWPAIQSSFNIPPKYKRLSAMTLTSMIKQYSFKWLGEETVVIYFKLTDQYPLNVVLIRDRKPTYDDLKNNQIISKLNPIITKTNEDSTESVGYLGILADPTSNIPSTAIIFAMQFVAVSCIQWNELIQEWDILDDSMTLMNKDQLGCIVNTSGIYSVQNRPLNVFDDNIGFVPLFELHLQSTYIIFIVVALLFLIYCIFLIQTAIVVQKNVYYLSDNVSPDRYGYLIIVYTGSARNSGTTSCIVIQLFGKVDKSKPHVLNYPDPQARLLQRNAKDIFVLAASKHLGRLRQLDVWFDSSGASPSWYCHKIIVFDMQKVKEYVFEIDTRFSVIYEGITFKSFLPCDDTKTSFLQKIRIFNEYHTWHFKYSNEQENLSNMKRLTIILSNILWIQVLDLAIHGFPKFQLNDCFDPYTHFWIDYLVAVSGIFSAAISFAIHITIAWLFRYSKVQFCTYSQHHLPFAFRTTLLLWFTLIVLILISLTILITCGFWVPYNSSLVWLLSSSIAIANDVLIYENLFILVQRRQIHTTIIDEIRQNLATIVVTIEKQRFALRLKFGREMLRPFFQHLYKKLSIQKCKIKARFSMQRRKIVVELEDFLWFIIYIILAFIVIFTNRAAFTLIARDALYDQFDGEFTRSMSFSRIESIVDIYKYLNDTLLPVIHTDVWYGNKSIRNEEMTIDAQTKVLGVTRIRQHRSRFDSCKQANEVRFLNAACIPDYSEGNIETRLFDYSWKSPAIYTNEYQQMRKKRRHSIWRFYYANETGDHETNGIIAKYSGGGYIAPMGKTSNDSQFYLNALINLKWFDSYTRAVLIECLTYNANTNVFSSVSLAIELSSSGYICHTIRVVTDRMLYNLDMDAEGIGAIVTFVLYCICVMLVTLKHIGDIYHNYRLCYTNAWFVMSLLLNSISIICISLFLHRMILIKNYINELETNNYNVYVSYSNLFYYDELLTVLQALLVTVGTIRLWRYLRFGRTFRILEQTLLEAFSGLAGAGLAFFIVLISFTQSGSVLFGNDFVEFSSLMGIFRMLMTMCLKPNKFHVMTYIEHDFSYAYFVSYLIIMLINTIIYVVVIVIAYLKARLMYSNDDDGYTIKNYIKDQWTLLPKLIKYRWYRLRGGEDADFILYVTRKSDAFMYANSLSLTKVRMLGMFATIRCLLRNRKKRIRRKSKVLLSDLDFKYMLQIAQVRLRDDNSLDTNLCSFFKGMVQGQNVQLIDERRIETLAGLVEYMLQSAENRIGRGKIKKKPEKVVKAMKLIKAMSGTIKQTNGKLFKINQRLKRIQLE